VIAGLVPSSIPVSATCTRVAVSEGHTEAVTVSLGAPAGPADVAAAFRDFGRDLARLELPSAPRRLITVHADPFRPPRASAASVRTPRSSTASSTRWCRTIRGRAPPRAPSWAMS